MEICFNEGSTTMQSDYLVYLPEYKLIVRDQITKLVTDGCDLKRINLILYHGHWCVRRSVMFDSTLEYCLCSKCGKEIDLEFTKSDLKRSKYQVTLVQRFGLFYKYPCGHLIHSKCLRQEALFSPCQQCPDIPVPYIDERFNRSLTRYTPAIYDPEDAVNSYDIGDAIGIVCLIK